MLRLSPAFLLLAATLFAAVSGDDIKGKKCVVKHTEGKDDTENILSAFKKCSKDATIVFEEGNEYNAWTPVQFHDLCSSPKFILSYSDH